MARTKRRAPRAAPPVPVEPLLDDRQVAAIFNVSPQTIANGRCRKVGIFGQLQWIKLGNTKASAVRTTGASVRRLLAELNGTSGSAA